MTKGSRVRKSLLATLMLIMLSAGCSSSYNATRDPVQKCSFEQPLRTLDLNWQTTELGSRF